jgi:asparaginyl-tRNA synthetase
MTQSLTDTSITPPRSWQDPHSHSLSVMDSPWYQMLTQVYGLLLQATNAFYAEVGITPVLLPLTASAVSSPMGLGSDSLPVHIDLFDERVYLADSMQFQLEFILRHGLPGAYYVMPSFRGEDADETHLNQFYHSEAEILGGLDDVMRLVEQYVFRMTRCLLEHPVSERVAEFAGGLDHLAALAARDSIPKITFEEALQLEPCAFRIHEAGFPVITRQGEVALIKKFGGTVWVTHPPHESVPFYQRRDATGHAECADLLLGVGEVVGCGARHLNGDEVRAAIASHGVEADGYKWYIEMKDRHPLATAGFGLGLERYVLWLLNHDDIRDLHAIPRIKGLPTYL